MNQKYSFRAVIEDAGGGGAFVTIPFDVEQVFGKKRVKVKAVIAGEPYRGSLVRMGGKAHILGVRKEIRHKAGVNIGDEIEVVVEEDTEPRRVEAPDDLQQALAANPGAKAVFDALSYTHQKETINWIVAAKRPATRQKRVAETVAQLLEGRTGR